MDFFDVNKISANRANRAACDCRFRFMTWTTLQFIAKISGEVRKEFTWVKKIVASNNTSSMQGVEYRTHWSIDVSSNAFNYQLTTSSWKNKNMIASLTSPRITWNCLNKRMALLLPLWKMYCMSFLVEESEVCFDTYYVYLSHPQHFPQQPLWWISRDLFSSVFLQPCMACNPLRKAVIRLCYYF